MPILWPFLIGAAYIVPGIITELLLMDTNQWPYDNDMIVAAWPLIWFYYGAKYLLSWSLRCFGFRIVWR